MAGLDERRARLEERLADAQAAIATLDEVVSRGDLSTVERDGAILRFAYTFEAIWRAAALLLSVEEGVDVRHTPKDVIRACRSAGLLSDEDAEAAIRVTDDRNAIVHTYKEDLAEALGERLIRHAALLHRWLTALRARGGPSRTYRLFEQAMAERKQVVCLYDGYRRELCPIILGHSQGEEKALTYQFEGEAKEPLPPGGQWKCLWLSGVSEVQLRDGPWRTGSRHMKKQTCVEIVDLDVNPNSPYNPKRRLTEPPSSLAASASKRRRGRSGDA
ncbi:MAG TPA: nucleotidyltransferase substrate binding protein [Stellaceae bacterium]|nr:nucleotidyltransferase substrate binding protein [Stellaceae bacterium]